MILKKKLYNVLSQASIRTLKPIKHYERVVFSFFIITCNQLCTQPYPFCHYIIVYCWNVNETVYQTEGVSDCISVPFFLWGKQIVIVNYIHQDSFLLFSKARAISRERPLTKQCAVYSFVRSPRIVFLFDLLNACMSYHHNLDQGWAGDDFSNSSV